VPVKSNITKTLKKSRQLDSPKGEKSNERDKEARTPPSVKGGSLIKQGANPKENRQVKRKKENGRGGKGKISSDRSLWVLLRGGVVKKGPKGEKGSWGQEKPLTCCLRFHTFKEKSSNKFRRLGERGKPWKRDVSSSHFTVCKGHQCPDEIIFAQRKNF